VQYRILVNITGPPNSGKHYLGKVLAKEEHAPFIEITLSELAKRTTKEIEELSKNIQEVRKGVIFLHHTAEDEETDESTNRFIEELKKNKGLIILVASNKYCSNIKIPVQIKLQLSNSLIYKEILKKYANHLNEKEINVLTKYANTMSINEVIGLCKYVETYWIEHSENKERPPLKLYISMVTNK